MFGFKRPTIVVMAFALASCGHAPAPGDGVACYPATAKRWIGASSSSDQKTRDPGGPYSVYIDGSASMAGYLRGSTSGERTLADLVGMLPSLPGIAASTTERVRFDRKVTSISSADMARLQTEAGYTCRPGSSQCDARESHVDQALARVAASDRNGLSVIVSDLWLTNSEIKTTGGVALSKPLADILASGRGVAIYGLESPYAGRVYDLPSGSATVVAKRRYLFIVAAGPPSRLDALHAAMMRAPSASIAADLASGKAHYSLFTTDPVLSVADGTQDFKAPATSLLKRTAFLPVRQGVRIPQYDLSRDAALRAGPGGGESAVWRGVSERETRPGAVWSGPSRGEASLFEMTGERCLPDGGDWRSEGAWKTGWDQESFKVEPAELAVLPRGKYLLVGRLSRNDLETPNPATAWFRAWSFDAVDERTAIGKPVMPTLNLGETARLMENALAQAAEARPMEIGGFAVAVQVD